MQIPKWIKSITTMLSDADRRLCLPPVALGATIASLSAACSVAAQGTKAHAEDIQNVTDSGFTKKNEKYILTVADSFVIRKRDTVRFGRETAATAPVQQVAPTPSYAPPSGGHSSHYSHSSHASHSSHGSHRSGGV